MLNFNNPSTKWLFLLAGSSGIVLSGPMLQIGLTGWIIPLGIVYFMHHSRLWKGYLWTLLFMTVFIFLGSLYSSALPVAATLTSAILSAILDSFPYLLHRIFHKRLKPIYSILFLPAIGVTYEYLISLPLSSIGALAATQTGFIQLAQVASITGVFGISFLMYWLAAIIVMALQTTNWSYFKAFGMVAISLFIYGSLKIQSFNPAERTVKVSGIVVEEYDLFAQLYQQFFHKDVRFDVSAGSSPEMNQLFGKLKAFQKDPSNEAFKNAFVAMREFEDEMIAITEREAKNGSQLIVWSETNLSIFEKDEPRVLDRIKQIAREHQVTILTSMAVLLPYVEGGPMYDNRSVLINPLGTIVDEYEKAKPVPFMDASLPGDGILEIIPSDYGNLTIAICYDADFPDLIAQSAKADILLLPANDWLGVSPYHGNQAMYRAIENGVSVVRPTGTGQSVVFNPHGEALARLGAFDQKIRVVNASVPVKGVKTIYSLIGNGFIWFCMLAALGLMGKGMVRPMDMKK